MLSCQVEKWWDYMLFEMLFERESFSGRSSATLNEWWIWPDISMFNQSPVAGTRTYTWGWPMWFNHLPHPQSFVCCRAHCAEYGGECVSWQQMHATWGIGFGYQVFEPPVSQRKGWNRAPRWIILLMDKILHQERMIIIPLLIGF